jgi:hypothetical protein
MRIYISLKMLLISLLIFTPLKAMEKTKDDDKTDLSKTFDLFEGWQHVHAETPLKKATTDVALLYYAQKGNTPEVQQLLLPPYYIPVNTQDPITGDTALHVAVTHNNNEGVIQELLKHKASLLLSNKEGNTPLHTAIIKRKKLFLIDLLLNHSEIKKCCCIKNNEGSTPLFLALRRLKRVCCPKKNSRHKETIHDKDNIMLLIFRLLEAGYTTQVNIPNNNNILPIHVALKTQEQGVIKKLIALGATAQDQYNPTKEDVTNESCLLNDYSQNKQSQKQLLLKETDENTLESTQTISLFSRMRQAFTAS